MDGERGASLKLRLDRAWGLLTRAEMRMATGKYQTAMDDLVRALQIDPDFTEALVTRGYLRYMQEDYPGALIDLETAGIHAQGNEEVVTYLDKLKARVPGGEMKTPLYDKTLEGRTQ